MRKSALILLAFIVACTMEVAAQTRTISGRVTDAQGAPVPNVSVTVKGSSVGTTTDADGNYTISVPANGRTLVFSSVNFSTQEQSIGNGTAVNVNLAVADRSLDEVVVVGYGTQRRRDVTAAVGKVPPGPIANLVTPSIDRQLGGRTPGVQVTTGSGLVNQAPRIRIRGVNSINGARGPLVVVDGIPVVTGNFSGVANTNALADINPNDVESIEVLKDGSATAIYGSRAANGVLLITTKKGRNGKSNVNFSSIFGFARPYQRFELLNAEQFVTIANEKFAAASLPLDAALNAERTNTDWQDYIYRPVAGSQIHNLSVDGGNDRSSYYFSANYTDQEGMVITNKVKRYALRLNLDHRVNKWLKVSNQTTLSRTQDNDQNNGGNALSGAVAASLRALPNVRVFNPSGDPRFGGFNVLPDGSALGRDSNRRAIENNYSNIGFVLNRNRITSTKTRILNNIALELKPVSWLTVTAKGGIDYLTGIDFQALDPAHGDGRGVSGQVFNQNIDNLRWVTQGYANAVKSFGDHNFNFTVGTEFQNEQFRFFSSTGQNLSDIFFLQQNITTGSFVTPQAGGGYDEGPGFASYFSRLSYNFANRYFIEGAFRRDGLSRFAQAKRFGNFPGVSVGWRLSEEGFWKNSSALNFFDEFKLRASWARVGNDQIAGGLFPFLSQYATAPYGGQGGIAISGVGNSDLTWETQEKYNVGADLALFDNRLNITADWFINRNNGLVLAAPLPVSFGIPGNSILRNIGDMESRGIELTVGGDVIRSKDLTWNLSVNYTNVRNEVKALYLNQDVPSAYNILRVGQPINALYGYRWAGVNPLNGNPTYFKADGTRIQGNISNTTYYLINNDGSLGTQSSLSGTADRAILGNVLPTWFGGINSSLNFKGFGLDMLWRYSGGNKIFNLTRQEALLNQAFQNNGVEILQRWTKPGEVTNVPRLWQGRDNFTNLQGNGLSRFVENGDFVRLENLQLSYGIGNNIVSRLSNNFLKSARVFVQGQNLILITKYTGIDPENITEAGIDNNTVPQPRTLSFGFNIGF